MQFIAPKKPTKKKAIKFFTVVANARIGGEIGNDKYTDVFKTRQQAAKFIAQEVNDYIEQEDLDEQKVTARDCKDGYVIYAE